MSHAPCALVRPPLRRRGRAYGVGGRERGLGPCRSVPVALRRLRVAGDLGHGPQGTGVARREPAGPILRGLAVSSADVPDHVLEPLGHVTQSGLGSHVDSMPGDPVLVEPHVEPLDLT